MVYRRSREAMPAYEEEIEEAEHEGVTLRLLTAPVEVVLEGKRVAGIKCVPMRLGEFDRSGRRRPEEGGDAFIIQADHVLVAIGQTLDLQKISNSVPAGIPQPGVHPVNPVTGQTSEKWIFSGGDAVTGPSSVVEAVAAGERAAVGIDLYLTGKNHAFWREAHEVDTSFDPDAEPSDAAAREAEPDSRRAAAEQFRRSGAALARGGGRPPGRPLPALRLRETLCDKLRRRSDHALRVTETVLMRTTQGLIERIAPDCVVRWQRAARMRFEEAETPSPRQSSSCSALLVRLRRRRCAWRRHIFETPDLVRLTRLTAT